MRRPRSRTGRNQPACEKVNGRNAEKRFEFRFLYILLAASLFMDCNAAMLLVARRTLRSASDSALEKMCRVAIFHTHFWSLALSSLMATSSTCERLSECTFFCRSTIVCRDLIRLKNKNKYWRT